MFLLNDVKITLHDKPIEKDMDKWKYEQAVSERKKQHSLIKFFLGETLFYFKKK